MIIFFISKSTKSELNNNFSNSIKEEEEENNIINETNKYGQDIYYINTTKQFDLNIKINGTEKNILIILFYSINCGHCKRFHPIYNNISEILKNNTNIKFSKMEISHAEEVFAKYKQIKVPSIPMVYMYKNGNFFRYEGKRNEKEIISFINGIQNFECKKILSLSELTKFINYKTIFSLDKENQFILGLFKSNIKDNNNSFIINNFIELNTLNNLILLNNNCFYYFYDDKVKNMNINETNFYLNNILYNNNKNRNDETDNNYLIYSYNYQRGLNTFPLFNIYLIFKNNSTKLKDYNNIHKHIKIIKNKYKIFLNNNYLYKYYYINNDDELKKFINYNKNYIIFNFKSEQIHKLFLNEINYFLSLNNSLTGDYIFILSNTSNSTKYSDKEGILFYNPQDFSPVFILSENELNKTNIEFKIFEYIYRDQNNLIESQMDFFKNTVINVKSWLINLFNDKSEEKNVNNTINMVDSEQKLIDEINKTIIEDEKLKKKEQKEKIENYIVDNEKNNNNIVKNTNHFEYNEKEEFGFNKRLILFPFYLIIYTILYIFFYKYFLLKYEDKIIYKRLPTEDPKNK